MSAVTTPSRHHRGGAGRALLPLALFVASGLTAPAPSAQDVGADAGARPSDAPRPITHEDVWTLRRLGSPVVAPDGSFAVVSVTEPSYDDDTPTRSDLWWVPTTADRGAPRRLTNTGKGEGGAAIRPDGRMLAFTAKREGDDAAQLYVMPLDGPGAALRITTLSTGVSSPVWSPDGTRVAFTSAVVPGLEPGDEAQAAEAKRREKDGVEATVYEHFPVRDWDHWRTDARDHVFVVGVADDGSAATSPPRDLLHGTRLAAGTGFSGASGVRWTPDGEALVFTCSTNQHEAARAVVPDHGFVVAAAGSEPERITPDGAEWSDLRFSPDGKRLYAVRRELTSFVYNLPRVVVMAWSGRRPDGAPESLAPEFDRPVTDYVAVDAGRPLHLVATDAGRRRVFIVRPGAATAVAVDPDGRGVYGGLAGSADGSVLVATYEDSATPAEVVRIAPDAVDGHVALSRFNEGRLDGVAAAPFEEFWFESSKGRRIHCWVAFPPGLDRGARRAYPLAMWMHGGPHSSQMDKGHVRWDMRLLAAPGHVVVAPDYTGSVGYGEAFSRAIQDDPLRTPGEEIMEAADAAAARYPFVDPTRQCALGASYGGHLANWLQAVGGDRFRTLVGHAGLASLEGQWATSDAIHHRERNLGSPPWAGDPVWQEQSPHTYAADFRTPMLLTIGEKDYRVPLNQTLHMWTLLKRRDVPSRLVVFHQANHWIMRRQDAQFFWAEMHGWLDRWLGGSR